MSAEGVPVPETFPAHRNGWATSDGGFFSTRAEAEQHQQKLDFFAWCETAICNGGPWTSRMVAQEIWDNWAIVGRSNK